MLRLLLIAVYSAFFVVQIYLDASTLHSFPRTKYCAKVEKENIDREKYLRASDTPDIGEINVLVNKRFHPEDTLSAVYTFDVPQPVFISRSELKMLVIYPHVLPVLADSLRAPPAGLLLV